jgi:hypothetical protein
MSSQFKFVTVVQEEKFSVCIGFDFDKSVAVPESTPFY